ncbi:phasin family protein [Rhodobacteraceae bacterium RKSG542]|uniref:phasin family protein n=1 Tax=Pseudovibrio flavus TaxID=2529854 RepID=UPI0012BCF2F3|nr:phasin family protein [Pseudovibrio flavus]MTI16398.1 phasin family protein [Pseudovibrio flavus]
MVTGFESMQKLGKENMDVALESFGAMSKGMQAITAEMADYSKKSVEESGAAFEKFAAAKSLDKLFEAQTNFAKSSYESFVGEFTKIGEMYADMARDAYKPYEGSIKKAGK